MLRRGLTPARSLSGRAFVMLLTTGMLTASSQLVPSPSLPVLPLASAPTPGGALPVLPQAAAPPAVAPAAPAPIALGNPAVGAAGAQGSGYAAGLSRPPFPLGAATAAAQIEGAAFADGRRASIWDTFAAIPGKTRNGDTPTVADDFYNRYLDDIATAKALGVRMMRISVSWSRVLPTGSGQVNQLGLAFYGRVIDALISAGIEPHVTLYHWDLPQALQDAYGGWLSPTSIQDFANYARVVFDAFASRVRHWTTFNEMQTFIQQGYSTGSFAPGRCSDRAKCAAGDSNSEPWAVLHNVLLAHGYAAAALRAANPAALISCNFNVNWAVPLRDTPGDQAAVQRYLDWHLGVYADPLFFGAFPASVAAAGIPALSFTTDEQNLLRGSVNYFALNHYTSSYVTSYDTPGSESDSPQEVNVSGTPNTGNTRAYAARDGVSIGPQAQSGWLYVYPPGMRALLKYVDSYYRHPVIYITENGVDVPGESDMPFQQALNDTFRIDYLKGYVQGAIDAATLDGVNVQGYFVWSLLDNFEWLDGYSFRFGIVRVEFGSQLTRYAKESAKFLAAWFSGASLAAGGAVASGNVSSFSVG